MLIKTFFGLVKITFGLERATYSLPAKLQAVKLTFYETWSIWSFERCKIWKEQDAYHNIIVEQL